jgi:hypothetical protein
MSYTVRVNGKDVGGQGYGRLQTAINIAETMDGERVEVVDEGADVARVVWSKKAKRDSHV